LDTDTALQKAITKLAHQYLASPDDNINALNDFRNKERNRLWNEYIWQVGIASLQSSPDSLISQLQFTQIGLWTSVGIPVTGKTQLLLGGKLTGKDSVQWQVNASLGARFYYGTNQVKLYLQGEYDYKYNTNSLTGSIGCQFNITNGLWGEFAINLVMDSRGKVSYQPGFNLGLGTPEKKKS
jgi:hypothetical protein